MKKLMLIVAVLLVAATCQAADFSAWILTAPDSDVNLRVGQVFDDVEVCLELGWDQRQDMETVSPDRAGIIGIYHLTQILKWEDTPVLSPFAGVLNTLEARPYVGLGVMMGWHEQIVEAKWVAGMTFADNPARPWCFIIEYQDGDGPVTLQSDTAIFLGMRFQF